MDSAWPVPPLLPPAAPGPDYDGLASFLNNFLSPPNNFGEISINADEAQQLRRRGWSARAGTWRAPLIPWSAIAPYRLLWLLDDNIDPHCRPGVLTTALSPDLQLAASPLPQSSLRSVLIEAVAARVIDQLAGMRPDNGPKPGTAPKQPPEGA